MYALTQTGKKATHIIKALKIAMLVMEVLLAIKTDYGPVCASEIFNDILQSWKIKHSTGIPCNPQGQAIVETKVELTKVSS